MIDDSDHLTYGRRDHMEKHRVVVTGVGLLCGIGNSADEVWAGLMAGKSGMGKITQFDATGFPVDFAAEAKGFDPLHFMDKKLVRKTGRFIHFAVAAAQQALQHSGLVINADNAERVGVHVGSGIGGFEVIEREHTNLMKGGPRKISPFFIPASIVNMAAGMVSIQFGAKGPNESVATACTTGAHAIGDAYEIIERGDADAMIAGGTEAAITPLSMAGFASMRALSARNSDPEHACRPFDKDRDGFVLGEGAGILILESLDSAERRESKDPCGIDRLRAELGCIPYDCNGTRRGRLLSRHEACASKGRSITEPHRLSECSCDWHSAGRRSRIESDSEPLWREGAKPQSSDQFDKIDDWSSTRWQRRTRGGYHRALDIGSDSPSDNEP